MEFLIFAAIAVVVLSGIGVWVWLERRRRQAIEAIASQAGFVFHREGDGPIGAITCRRHLLSLGRSPSASNLLSGSIGDVDVLLFDYVYTTGSGKNSSRHRQTVAAYRVPGAVLPAFELRPESVFHKIGAALGFRDIDLPGYPEFSKRVLLRGEDEASVAGLFDDETTALVMGLQGVSIEGSGEWVMVYRASRRTRPDDLLPFMEQGFTIATALTARVM